MKKINIIYKNIDELKAYEKNPRKNDGAVQYVKESINKFGFKNPVIIDKNDIIVCGHTRVKSAKELGITEVPCIIADDLSKEQVKAFRLADNKVSEFAEWDFELLSEELEDILTIDMEDLGFDLDIEMDEEEPKERKDLSDELKETFEVIIECNNELEQEEIFYRLTKEGYDCRVLTL